jgi:hypothetical protein
VSYVGHFGHFEGSGGCPTLLAHFHKKMLLLGLWKNKINKQQVRASFHVTRNRANTKDA